MIDDALLPRLFLVGLTRGLMTLSFFLPTQAEREEGREREEKEKERVKERERERKKCNTAFIM